MRKLSAALFGLMLIAPLAGCGGGSEDVASQGTTEETTTTESEETTTTESQSSDSEFCDAVHDVADTDVLNDFDFSDPETVRDAQDALKEVGDVAPSDISDAFDDVDQQFDDLLDIAAQIAEDPDNEDAILDENGDVIDDFYDTADEIDEFTLDECGITVDGRTPDDVTTTTSDSGNGGGDELSDPTPPSSFDDPELADLADQCFEGSGSACDTLYGESDLGSEEELYGGTCANRTDESTNGDCEELIGN